MVDVKYGLDRYCAGYDQLIRGAKRMPPIYHAIHLGPIQTDIRRELAVLAELPEAKRRWIVESYSIDRGYGSTMMDMVDRNRRGAATGTVQRCLTGALKPRADYPARRILALGPNDGGQANAVS